MVYESAVSKTFWLRSGVAGWGEIICRAFALTGRVDFMVKKSIVYYSYACELLLFTIYIY